MSSLKPPPKGSDRWLRSAQRYLRYGVRSRTQLQTYLETRGASIEVANRAVEACARAGLIDDRVAAKLWGETLADRGFAQAAIHTHLIERGFDESTVGQTLNALRAREDDESRARTLVANTWKHSSGSPPQRRASVARRLARCGFDAELIDRLLAHDP